MHRIKQNSKCRWQNRRVIQDGTHYLKSDRREGVSALTPPPRVVKNNNNKKYLSKSMISVQLLPITMPTLVCLLRKTHGDEYEIVEESDFHILTDFAHARMYVLEQRM